MTGSEQTGGEQEVVEAIGDFVRLRKDVILWGWRAAVLDCTPAGGLSEPALLNHMPRLLERLGDEVQAMAAGTWRRTRLDEVESHALERLAEGIEISDVLTEFSLLRNTILGLASSVGRDFRELALLNWAIDEAVQQSAQAYTRALKQLLKAIDRLSSATLESRSLDDLLPALLRIILEIAPDVDTLAFMLLEGDTLRLRAAVGLEEELEEGFSVRIGEGFSGRIAQERAAVSLRTAAQDPLVMSRVIRQRGVRALLGVPVLADGELVGVMHMGSVSVAEFRQRDRLLLRAIADRAGAAILQHDLRARAERAAARTARIQAITAALVSPLGSAEVAHVILTQGVPLLEAVAASVGVAAGEDGEEIEVIATTGYPEALVASWRRFPRDAPGPSMDAFRSRAPVWLASEAEFVARYPTLAGVPRELGHGAWAALPLLVDGRPVGVLGLTFARSRGFQEEEKAFALQLSHLCAHALARAQLYQEVDAARGRAEEMLHSRDQTLALLDGVYRTAPVGLAFLDRELRYVRVNDALAELNGLDSAAHLGKRPSELFPECSLFREIERELRRALESGESRMDVELSGRSPGAPGILRHWLASWSPVRSGGITVGIGMAVREITRRRLAEEFQRHVLAIVGHDLRTPISAASLAAQALLRGGALGEHQMKSVAVIRASAQKMDRIVRDLLDYSRARAGPGLVIEPREADLNLVCQRVLEEAQAAHPGRDVMLERDADAIGLFDPDRLEQALSNLVSNALTHGNPGTPVVLRCQNREERIIVEVENEGPPVDPALVPQIFEPFRRGDDPVAGPSRGLGLGLFIAKEIVRAHRGQIEFHSADGRTVFRLTLPRRFG